MIVSTPSIKDLINSSSPKAIETKSASNKSLIDLILSFLAIAPAIINAALAKISPSLAQSISPTLTNSRLAILAIYSTISVSLASKIFNPKIFSIAGIIVDLIKSPFTGEL